MKLTDIGDLLRKSPMAWRSIPQNLRAEVTKALLPANGFTPEQRAYLARWWLACTQDDVDQINATLPGSVRVSAIDIGGSLYVGGDLLTDAITPGGTFSAALPILERLVCAYIEPEQFAEREKGGD